MTRAILLFAGFLMVLSACTQRTICPAFQSAFIYDKEALRKKFSYFQEDSTPKVFTASKNKYLVAEAIPYNRKVRNLQSVEMKDVNPVVPDSLSMDDDVSKEDLDSAARSVIDSIYIVDVKKPADSLQASTDSVYVITKDKEVKFLRYNLDSLSYRIDEIRYNIDQDNYMWYLRDALVLPDVRLAKMQATEEKAETEKKEKKGIRGFFKNLFKKKDKKKETDSTDMAPKEEKSEFDFDLNDQEPAVKDSTEQQPQKHGLFRKKTKKVKSKKEKVPAQPKENKEEPAAEEPILKDKNKDDEGGF